MHGMSIRVELDALADAIKDRGAGYLITTGLDGRPHTTSAQVSLAGATLTCGAGRKTGANIAAQPKVALLWAPTEPGDYSLIVDGDAVIEGEDDQRRAIITATGAILHRAAAEGGNDCKTV